MAHSNTPRGGQDKDANRDPITKTPGAHPVGTGVGAAAGGALGGVAAGAATGAVAGSTLGPAGTAAGIAVGAIAGGLAGKAVAEKIDPTSEDAYWREAHRKESYYEGDYNYDDYAPAYRTGYTGYGMYQGKKFEDVEERLQADYEEHRGKSRLGWDRAKHAVRAGWNRVENMFRRDESKRPQ